MTDPNRPEAGDEGPGGPGAAPGAWSGLRAAVLPCEGCRGATPHRIVRLSLTRRTATGQRLEGLARCSVCRLTRPFSIDLPDDVTVDRVASDGPRSTRSRLSLPFGERLRVGERLPAVSPPARVVRIDRRDGPRADVAAAQDIATVWTTPDRPRPVPVSLLLGSRTATSRLELPPTTELVVGGLVQVAGGTVRVVGLRARRRTWSHPGARFAFEEIQRVYARPEAAAPRERARPGERPLPRFRRGPPRRRPRARPTDPRRGRVSRPG